MSSTSAVRIGLIGNSFAEKVQLPALRYAGGNEVVGIAGFDGAKARATAERWGIPHASDRWESVLALEPDLVLISTPVDLHAPMVRAALGTGAAVLCEKPFTLDVAEAEDLVIRAAGRLAVIGHQLRWNPFRRRMRALVREGFIGALWYARVEWVFGSKEYLERPYRWWFDAARGGGILGAGGSHFVDGVQWMLGDVEAVRARLLTFQRERPDAQGVPRIVTADEHATLWLRLARGGDVTVTASAALPGAGSQRIVELVGSEGTLRLEDEERLVGARHGDDLTPIEVEGELPSSAALGIPDLGPFARLEPLFLRDLIAAVARGDETLAGAASFADGLACMRVLDAARRSAAGGEWVACR